MLAVLHTCHIKKKRFENLFSSMIYLNPHKKLTKHDVRSFPKKARSQKLKKKNRKHLMKQVESEKRDKEEDT